MLIAFNFLVRRRLVTKVIHDKTLNVDHIKKLQPYCDEYITSAADGDNISQQLTATHAYLTQGS